MYMAEWDAGAYCDVIGWPFGVGNGLLSRFKLCLMAGVCMRMCVSVGIAGWVEAFGNDMGSGIVG
jgi:hypothetical protein